MKKLLFTLTLAAALAVGSTSAFAETKKSKKDTAADASADKSAAAPADKPKADDAKAKAEKPIPMYVHADEIDLSAKTITQVTKDGRKSVNTLTATTEIKNGEAEAKFEDIKVGDYISGSRKKTADGEYEVVKITKFGPKAEKATDAKKPAAKPATKPAK